MAELLQFIITGISVGMVYALIALGFVLVWKSSSVANLALGQIVLISSWFTYSMLAQAELPVYIAFPVVILFALFLGWIIERFALRPLIAQPILSLITVTLGIGYFIEGVITFIWPWSVDALPRLFPREVVHIGPAVISQEYVWVIVICLVVFILLTAFFRYHKMGIAMRATADDQMAVQACGIPVTRVFSTSWMFACVVAAIGGVLISSISGITHGLVETGLKAFSVVILGGLDSFAGAIIAGPIIGLCESLGGGYLTPYIWAGVRDIIPFVIIIIVMVIKPYGLFGEERIERI
jgi:branched-chain amino acid transport system permease protein